MTSKDKFKLLPASHLFLFKQNKILLLRRFNTGYEDGNYSVVAGHLDGNESFTQAIIREAQEEAGIKVISKDLRVVHVMNRRKPDGEERIDFFIMAKSWKGEPKVMEPDKCDDLSWFSLDNLPNNIIPHIKYAIECTQQGVFYSEYGW
ncbi:MULTISPECIES: NUDIX hydrolase [unclassified Roseofilum]|uniref:NUDIX hydrolase n=1 Tax=unclassified Roseofilum TaxID=2620099 RepID=UPI000E978C9F|nr:MULTISPECIES: NUDIX domain-containing protein [unclassified Roseofilum]MBP0010568.1 NUDIX domain-containing protein [Roseofilum sp. Belize Diploria]MBP0035014.1 NUDIX domain-containing protein [Roseofilum sp. Belize BBD 4]HBQ97985.1 NUDIX hydrolase [Cyanobacteria bacterium UBA11691]